MIEYIIRETGYPGAVEQEVVGELVRCKECKWKDKREGVYDCHNPTLGDGYGYYAQPCLGENGFCSKGERSEDGEMD